MASLLGDFEAAVQRYPDRVAIIDGKGRETSFTALKSRVDALARSWQKRGIRKGDRVLIAMGLDADLYAGLAALWSLGATAVLPEPAMGLTGLRHAAKTKDVTAFCSSGYYGILKYLLPELWFLKHLRPNASLGKAPNLPDINDSDTALISFTSGTSGTPKAIARSHGFLTAQHQAIAPVLRTELADRDLVAFPVFVLINIASGRTSVLPNWKMSKLARLGSARLTGWIDRQKITRALIPPSLCEKLAQGDIPNSLHTIFTGGGPVFPDMLETLKQRRSTLKITCVYGSTEAEPIAHLHEDQILGEDRADMMAGKGLLVGHPVPEIDVRIAGDEIQVAGAHVNSGYLDPKHDVENKIHDSGRIWHRTGDAGYFDDQKRLWLLGRIGSEVTMANGPVFPFSIEVAAQSWPCVTQCAFVETPTGACLVVAGDVRALADWKQRAKVIGIDDIRTIAKIPMDRRHASKVDRLALIKTIGQG